MKRISSILLVALVLSARADVPEPLPYTEGTVWGLSLVRTKAGFQEDYLRSLNNTWRKVLDEAKKQKLVLSYRVLATDAVGREDWNLILMIEYRNMAALDGLDEKMRNLTLPMLGGEDKTRELMVKRLDVREIVATKLARELIFR